jgi:DNA-binding response OmpR family regulator
VVSVAEVLVVEGDPRLAVRIGRDLRALGHRVRTRRTVEDALLASAERRADLLLLDVDLDGRPGEDLVSLLDRGLGRPPVILLFGSAPA